MPKEMSMIEIAQAYMRNEISATDDRVKKVEDLLGEMASTEDGRQEIAETIAIYIDQKFNMFDIAPYLCNYRNFNLGETPEFRLKKKGIQAYWIAPNSYTPKSRNYQETLSMEFETISARPECFIDEIRSGRIQGFAELVSDTIEAVQKGIVAKVFTLLNGVYKSGMTPDLYETNSTSLSAETLKTAIQTVRYNTGVSPVIIGNSLITDQIAEFDGYTDVALEEIRKTGKIGLYRGATIIGVPEVENNIGEKIVPEDKLYVVSSKIGYAGTYGATKSGQESSIDDWSWNARFDKSWGMCVTDVKGMFLIAIT